MSEDINKDLENVEAEIEQIENDNQEVSNDTSDSFEAKAREQGWCPQDEWRGDPAQWKPAEQFVKDGEDPRYRELLALRKQLKAQTAYTEIINKNLQDIRKAEYEKAKQELTKQRDDAIIQGELDKVYSTEEQLKKLTPPEEHKLPGELDPYERFWDQWGHLKNPQTPEETQLALDLQYHNKKFLLANPGVSKDKEVDHMLNVMAEITGKGRSQSKAPSPTPTSTTSGATRSTGKVGSVENLRSRVLKQFGKSSVALAQETARKGYMTEEEYYKDLLSMSEQGLI